MSDSRAYGDSPELAELYDLVPQYTSRPDRQFYLEICQRSGGPVLELGCGTGRVLADVAAQGLPTVGLDSSPHMLERFRHRLAGLPEDIRRGIRLVQADMTDFDLGETFGTILIPFRPLQHLLTVEDQVACFCCVNRHLKAGGTLAFDVFHPHLAALAAPPETQEQEEFPDTPLSDGRSVRRCRRIPQRHRAEQYFDVELIYYLTDRDSSTRRLVHAFAFRYFFRYEVEHLLARTGFRIVQLYGSFARTPLADDSPEMIFIARKSEDESRAGDR